MDPLILGDLAQVNAASGNTAEAHKIINEMMDRAKRDYVAPSFIAGAFGALGDKDKAFEWLEKGYAEHDAWLNFLVDPWWDPIRSDPRFVDLEKRIGLPQ